MVLIWDWANLATPGNGFRRHDVNGRRSGLETLVLIQIEREGMHGGGGWEELRNNRKLSKKNWES